MQKLKLKKPINLFILTNFIWNSAKKSDGLVLQTLLHHACGITGALQGIYLGGFLGSIS